MMGRLGSATVNGRYSAFGDAVLARNASVDNQNTLKMLSNRRGPKGASDGERLVAQLPNIGTAEAIEEGRAADVQWQGASEAQVGRDNR